MAFARFSTAGVHVAVNRHVCLSFGVFARIVARSEANVSVNSRSASSSTFIKQLELVATLRTE